MDEGNLTDVIDELMDASYIVCTKIGEGVFCNDSFYVLEEPQLTYKDRGFWLYCGAYVALVLAAGLMSGLTMGLLSLDLTSLKVLQEGGKPHERRYAAKIIPLVQRHHLLLVTLLLGNAAAVEAMPLCLDRISDPVTAILVSVTAVLIFGEVVPQALCTRYGLAIGAFLSPIVYLLMGLMFVVAYPISLLLDCLLGEEHGTFYRRAELKILVGMHGPQLKKNNSANEDPLTQDEVVVIKGALELREKKVADAMVPLQNVFMLNTDTVLNESTMSKILLAGHSRIPVYKNYHENIIGVLLVKTLLCLNLQQGFTLKDMMETKSIRPVHKVFDTMPLYELLDIFQTGRSHLSIVYSQNGPFKSSKESPFLEETSIKGKVSGIITLEDVIEELIQEEIYDEKDVPDSLLRYQIKNSWRMAQNANNAIKKMHRSEGDWLDQPLTSVSPVGGIQRSTSISISGEDERTSLLGKSSFAVNSLP